MRLAATAATFLALATSGCASRGPSEAPPQEPPLQTAEADIRESSGRAVATSSVTATGDSLRVRLDATGLPAGAYGTHLHNSGLCQPPTFESAGPHWNPTGRRHGRDNPQGQHLGDLPNLLVGTDGRGSLEFTIPGAALAGGSASLLDADGTSIVIHGRADDYRTDPSGNSGARIACGTLR
jgi:Cu-Zn family superoxide dismutase